MWRAPKQTWNGPERAWRSVGTAAHARELGEHPEPSLESLLFKASRPLGRRLPHLGDRSITKGGGLDVRPPGRPFAGVAVSAK